MLVITGASDGLGLQIARVFQESGEKVFNISLDDSQHADYNYVCDLTDPEQLHAAADQVLSIQEPISAFINCAGIYSPQKFGNISDAELDRVMKINAQAPLQLTSRLLGRLVNDKADIVNVTSTASLNGKPEHPLYSISKWAERGLSENLRASLQRSDCRVINFTPGGMSTNILKKAGTDVPTDNWIDPAALANLVKHILDLPKNAEVSDITIRRKAPNEHN